MKLGNRLGSWDDGLYKLQYQTKSKSVRLEKKIHFVPCVRLAFVLGSAGHYHLGTKCDKAGLHLV